jgi:putative transposase
MLASRLDFYNKNIKDKELSKTEKAEIYKSYKAPTEKELKQQYEYMKEVSSVALQQSRRDQEGAFTRFFKGLSKFPKFHSKKQKNSYREINVNNNCKFNWNHRIITLPKIRQVRFRNRELPKWLNTNDKICNITVSKNPSGQYYASILFEADEQPKLKSENQAIGLDFSPADEYVDSYGMTGKDFGYIPQKQAHLRQLRKFQRRFARKQKGSNNREKARIKVARIEQHIADSRRDWIEKETLRLVRSYNVIGIEDLTTKGLLRASKNARNYVDTSWGTFTSRLIEKSKKHDCSVVKSDRFFASSKLCHICGYKKTDLTLSVRHWTCPVCHTEHDRDVNAAINLKLNAIKILREAEEFRSAEGVEGLASLALAHFGASVETEREVS